MGSDVFFYGVDGWIGRLESGVVSTQLVDKLSIGAEMDTPTLLVILAVQRLSFWKTGHEGL